MSTMTQHDLIAAMRTYLRERSAEAGYATAFDEIGEAVLQIEMYGTSEKLNAQPRHGNKPMTRQPPAGR